MKIRYLKLLISFCMFSSSCFALEENAKLWLAMNFQKTLSEDKKWLAFIYTQLRTIAESHPLQAGLIEGGIGYQVHPEQSLWFGYRWTGHRPNNGFYQENRLFQQIILQKRLIDYSHLILRTRMEEIQRGNESQIALRLRQRIAYEWGHSTFKTTFPFIYDEVFIQLNNTVFTPHKLIGENRLFLGFNWFHDKTTWWELGYINQYQFPTPIQPQYQMSHIVSVTYNFV